MPDPIDVQIGASIIAFREAARVTQKQLADALGVTFQQIQKYERGVNRVSAARLYRTALFFNRPLADFFTGTAHGAAMAGGVDPVADADSRALLDQLRALTPASRAAVAAVVRQLPVDSAT